MDRRTAFWSGAGLALAGAAGAAWALRTVPNRRMCLRHTMPARPDRVTDLVRQVEREPELIPGVMRVQVLERGPDWVRYRVDLAGGTYAVYCKTWEEDRIAWSSECGTLGLKQTGLMRLEPRGGSTEVELTVQTDFEAPVLGPAAAAASYAFAAFAFRRWLENLSRTLARESAGLENVATG